MSCKKTGSRTSRTKKTQIQKKTMDSKQTRSETSNLKVKVEKEPLVVPGDEGSLQEVEDGTGVEEPISVNSKKQRVEEEGEKEEGKEEEEKKEESEKTKKEKIVDLFEQICGWDILCSTETLDILKRDEFNNIDLEIPFLLLPTSVNGNGKEYIDHEYEGFGRFSSVKEVLDFIVDWYFSVPKILNSLFPVEDNHLLTAYFCERINYETDQRKMDADRVRLYTGNSAKTTFQGVYFTKSGGMGVNLETF